MKNKLGLGPLYVGVYLLAAFLLLAGCGKDTVEAPVVAVPKPSPVFDPMSVELTDAALLQGRETWMLTCAQCHLKGLGGAPVIGDQANWGPRIAQGKATLYEHALYGYVGPQLNEMPAKGGFLELTDEAVKRAVDFVVFASQ